MSRRVSALALGLLWASGCVQVQEEVRVERGLTLRTWDTEVRLGRPQLRAEVAPRWPALELRVFRDDTCRAETREEYAEERTVERSARGTGPALALGSVGTIAGAGLLAGAQAMSDAPNREVLDAEGRYGPSQRQLAQGWGWGALSAGVPALVVALVGQRQSGTTTESTVQQSVVSEREYPCHGAKVDGLLRLDSLQAPFELRTSGGAVLLSAAQVAALGEAPLVLDGQPVTLPQPEEDKVVDFRACLAVLPLPPPERLAVLSAAQLDTRRELASACARRVPEGGAAEEAYTAALEAKLAAERDVAPPAGPSLIEFEDVLRALQPERLAARGTADALALQQLAVPAGEPLRVMGRVERRGTAELISVRVGERRGVFLSGGKAPLPGESEGSERAELVELSIGEVKATVWVPAWAGWDAVLRPGAYVEVVARPVEVFDAEGNARPSLLEGLAARAVVSVEPAEAPPPPGPPPPEPSGRR